MNSDEETKCDLGIRALVVAGRTQQVLEVAGSVEGHEVRVWNRCRLPEQR